MKPEELVVDLQNSLSRKGSDSLRHTWKRKASFAKSDTGMSLFVHSGDRRNDLIPQIPVLPATFIRVSVISCGGFNFNLSFATKQPVTVSEVKMNAAKLIAQD